MRKFVALLAAAALAASPVIAEAKAKKKTPEEIEKERIAQEHDNTYRAVRDGLPLVLPSWSLPIFFGTGMDKKLSGQDKKGRKGREEDQEGESCGPVGGWRSSKKGTVTRCLF